MPFNIETINKNINILKERGVDNSVIENYYNEVNNRLKNKLESNINQLKDRGLSDDQIGNYVKAYNDKIFSKLTLDFEFDEPTITKQDQPVKDLDVTADIVDVSKVPGQELSPESINIQQEEQKQDTSLLEIPKDFYNPVNKTTDQIAKNVRILKEKGTSEQDIDKYISKIGYSNEVQAELDEIQKFKKTPIGKTLDITGDVLTFLPELLGFSEKDDLETMIKKNYIRKVKGESPLLGGLKDTLKGGVQDALAAAQLMTAEVGMPIAKGVKPLLKFAGKQAAIQGGLGTAKRKVQGESTEEALKGGALEGAFNSTAILGIPAVTTAFKKTLNTVLKKPKASKIVYNYVKKNPEVLDSTTKSNFSDIKNDILDTFNDFANDITESGTSKFSKIKNRKLLSKNTMNNLYENLDQILSEGKINNLDNLSEKFIEKGENLQEIIDLKQLDKVMGTNNAKKLMDYFVFDKLDETGAFDFKNIVGGLIGGTFIGGPVGGLKGAALVGAREFGSQFATPRKLLKRYKPKQLAQPIRSGLLSKKGER